MCLQLWTEEHPRSLGFHHLEDNEKGGEEIKSTKEFQQYKRAWQTEMFLVQS